MFWRIATLIAAILAFTVISIWATRYFIYDSLLVYFADILYNKDGFFSPKFLISVVMGVAVFSIIKAIVYFQKRYKKKQ